MVGYTILNGNVISGSNSYREQRGKMQLENVRCIIYKGFASQMKIIDLMGQPM